MAERQKMESGSEPQPMENIGGGAGIWPACGPEKGTI